MHSDIERLKYVLGLVNDLLKFAETKHAALIALSGAAVWGVAGELCKRTAWSISWWWLVAPLGLFLISMGISFKSFFPKTKPKKDSVASSQNSTEANLYFFGDLSRFSPVDLCHAFSDRYNCDANFLASNEALDICNQLTTAAGIVEQKFKLFKWSIVFAGLGFALGCVVYGFQLGGAPCPS